MDNVVKPKHYTSGKIEVIDYIKDKLTPEQYKGYLLGNVIKYISRFRLKNGLEDLEKGRVYLDWLAKVEAGEAPKPPLLHGEGETEQLIPAFKPGDKIRNRDGSNFSNGKKVVTVRRLDPGDHVITIAETGTTTYFHYVEHVPVGAPKPAKSITDLCKEAYANAKEKGWHDKPRSFGDVIALIHSELSEALEDHRNGRGYLETWHEDGKPCGIPSELADVCIRIFDFCGEHGIDLEGMINEKMAYNATRPNRHGGKKL